MSNRSPSSRIRRLALEQLEPRWQMAAPEVSIADVAVPEGKSGTRQANFAVSLSEPAAQQVRVSYRTEAGSAKSGSDFLSRSGSVVFAPGQTTRTVSISIKGDSSVEPDETLIVRLSDPKGATLSRNAATGTIQNDDYPPPTANIANVTTNEEDAQATFVVRLHHSGPSPVTVRYTTKEGTAGGADFRAAQGTLVFGGGEFEKTVTVELANDRAIELAEQFSLVVSLGATSGPWLATATATIVDTDEVAPPTTPRLVGYFTSWGTYDRDYQVADIPAERLTHVVYAFAGISPQGNVELQDRYADIERVYPNERGGSTFHGNFHQLQLLKEAQPHLQTLLSVGGWDGSARFSDVAASAAARSKFVGSVIKLLEQYGFDGVDLDWEFPVEGGLPTNSYRPADKHNFTLLAQEFRQQIDARQAASGKHLLLTVALGAQPEQYANYELADLPRFADWVHLMSYDYTGPWSATTGHNSPLFASPDSPQPSIDSAVTTYLGAGVTPGKIVLGAPFYGYGWSDVADVQQGLFQLASGLPTGTDGAAGAFTYNDIQANWLPRMTRHWDTTAQVPWLYDPVAQIFITYDDPESLAAKARYVRDRGLGGMEIWELSGDDAQHALVRAIDENLRDW